MAIDLKIAVVTDIHHGTPRLAKRGDRALDLIDQFLGFCSDYGPDLIADLGDRINDQDQETDRRLLGEVAVKFRGLNTPHVHLDGNHDSDFLLPEDNAAAVDSGKHASRDVNGYHLVFWNASTKIPRPDPFCPSDDDMAWLAQDLASTQPADGDFQSRAIRRRVYGGELLVLEHAALCHISELSLIHI